MNLTEIEVLVNKINDELGINSNIDDTSLGDGVYGLSIKNQCGLTSIYFLGIHIWMSDDEGRYHRAKNILKNEGLHLFLKQEIIRILDNLNKLRTEL